MDTFSIEVPDRRRQSPEFRAAVFEAARRPGVSIAAVALTNGLNANMLRKWVNDAERADGGEPSKRVQVARCSQAEPATGRVQRYPHRAPARRQKVTDGTAMARAIDYSLKRWSALTRFLGDPAVPIDNNWIENRIRPIAIGRSNWLFAGSLRAGQRAAAVMSLIQSARINGHDPYAYLRDVLERLPTQPNSRIEKLLPHRWTPGTAT